MDAGSKRQYVQWDKLRVGREEHAFVCGATGTGKSFLVEYLINDPRKSFSVVYDPKHSRTLSEWRNQRYIYTWEELQSCGTDVRRIIYRPSLEEADDLDCQKAFFKWIYEQGYVRVFVDECSSLLGDSLPNKYLKGCLTRGRELGISVIGATQRPVSIPLITMSEATRFYVFRLNLEEDRKRIAKITGISDDEQARLKGHEFFYYDTFNGKLPYKITLEIPSY